jgi:hypothetical protein
LRLPLGDARTGGCCDGLHPSSVNRNQGAESILSYHLACVAIREFLRRRLI